MTKVSLRGRRNRLRARLGGIDEYVATEAMAYSQAKTLGYISDAQFSKDLLELRMWAKRKSAVVWQDYREGR